MKKIVLFLIGITIGIFFASCYTYKPIGKASAPDYNKRVNVTEAEMKKKSAPMNYVFKVSLAAGGGVAGYYVAGGWGAAIGAVTGLGTSYLCDFIAGKGKTKPVKDPALWIKKSKKDFNLKDYRFLSGSGKSFTIIHPSAESNFTIKSIQDIRDFKQTFPNSYYSENIVNKGITNLQYDNDYSTMAYLYPQYSSTIEAAYLKNTLNKTSDFQMFKQKISYFPQCLPDVNLNIDYQNEEQLETLFAQLDKYHSEIGSTRIRAYKIEMLDKLSVNGKVNFLKKFPNSELKNDILTLIPNSFSSIREISDFIKTNKEFNNQLDERAFTLVSNSNSENELQEYISVFPNGKYVVGVNRKIAAIKQAKIEEEQRVAAEARSQRQREEEQARLRHEAQKKEIELKGNSVGKQIYWYEEISFDTSGGGIGGWLLSKVGAGTTDYRIKYTAIVEAMIGESVVKAIITRGVIEDPKWVSVNYNRYKQYAIEEMNKAVGQTRVKEFHEFNLGQ